MTNETDRHLLNQDGLDQADAKIGLDVLPYDFESVHRAAWFVKGLMKCSRHDIEEIGKCRHWMAINGLIEAVRQEHNHDALLEAAEGARRSLLLKTIPSQDEYDVVMTALSAAIEAAR